MNERRGPTQFKRRSAALANWQSAGGAAVPPGAGRGGVGRPLAAIGVLLVALAMAFAVVNLISGDDGQEAETAQPSATTVGPQTGTSERVPSKPEGNTRAAPALRIHPQRAPAGSPLELRVDGIGCPGSAGLLSITEVGTAPASGQADRLVVRRRFDVDPTDQSFHAAPLLVGQPPGSYRVSIECERFRSAGSPAAPPSRQVFELTELLELTGPLAAREIEVAPLQPDPDLTTLFTVNASGCRGVNPRVELTVFPPRSLPLFTATPPVPVRLQPPVSRDQGTWSASTTIDRSVAAGTYTFEAVCFDGADVQFPYVVRHVHFGPLSPSLGGGGLAGLFDIFSPGDSGPAAKSTAAAAAASRAVPGIPRYTG